MLISEAYTRIRTFIVDVLADSSITVKFANDTAPRPLKPFVTISIGSLTNLSSPMRFELNNLGEQRLVFNKSFIVTLESYCDVLHQSEEILTKIEDYLSTEIAYSHFKGELAYMSTILGVSALPVAIGGTSESRSILEVEFYLTTTIQDKVGLIEHIHITDTNTGKKIIINK